MAIRTLAELMLDGVHFVLDHGHGQNITLRLFGTHQGWRIVEYRGQVRACPYISESAWFRAGQNDFDCFQHVDYSLWCAINQSDWGVLLGLRLIQGSTVLRFIGGNKSSGSRPSIRMSPVGVRLPRDEERKQGTQFASLRIDLSQSNNKGCGCCVSRTEREVWLPALF